MKKSILIVLCIFVQYSQARMVPSPTGTYTNSVVNHTCQEITFALTHNCSPESGDDDVSIEPGQTAYYELSQGRPEGQFLYIDGPLDYLPVCHEIFLGDIVHVYGNGIETQVF